MVQSKLRSKSGILVAAVIGLTGYFVYKYVYLPTQNNDTPIGKRDEVYPLAPIC